ncbi:MAG: sugar nucleotide-binding protein [Cyclobacteriaceae bacterium]|nr:sugar nucleotide-binding protein [Cyclobacteriaceae bacterium]
MKILVTGANGLLGQKLVELLQTDDSIKLIATAQRPLVINLYRGEFRLLDITDSSQVQTVIAETKPDVIIHTAAMTNVDLCETNREACWKANVTAVDYLVDSANRHHAHLIHVSTDFIFDGTEGPLDEQAKPGPVNFYGESKLKAEETIQAKSASWCILRTVLVYGITKDMSRSNIILVSHAMPEIARLCNVVVLVNDGQAILFEDVDEGIRAYQGTAGAPQPKRTQPIAGMGPLKSAVAVVGSTPVASAQTRLDSRS